MASESLAIRDPKNIKTVYYGPNDLKDTNDFVENLIRTLDVWDEQKGFAVMNEGIHGVPVGSILLWPHMRFHIDAFLSGAAENALRRSMKSHMGKMKKDQTAFQLNYYIGDVWKQSIH